MYQLKHLNLYGSGSANKQILFLLKGVIFLDKNYRNILTDLHEDDRIIVEETGEVLSDVMDTKDGPEFIICKMCRHNRGGGCRCEESMANIANPSDGLYFNICRGFSSDKCPISPAKFRKLMLEIRNSIVPEPGVSATEAYGLQRYNMEHLMAQMLIQLGYGEGAKVFLDSGFELPF